MTTQERWDWLLAIHSIFFPAFLDGRLAEWEFFNLWYVDLFNKGRRTRG